MHLAVDVHYGESQAVAAGILFSDYRSAEISATAIERSPIGAPYEPGAFYRRELPPLLALVRNLRTPDTIVIDGYVWLARGRPGLGAHLYEALGRAVPIIGAAKRRFAGNDAAVPVLRGASARPLYVTSAGVDADAAAEMIRAMAGPFRIPALLRAADRLARGG